MSDSTLNRFIGQGTNAEMLAFTPSPPTPASGPDQAYYFYDTDNDTINWWDGANWQATGGSGTVTNTGTLTDHALIVGNGGVDVSAVGDLGTTTKVLHGAAAGDPTWSAVVEADITLADNTTNDVSSTKHGFAPKSPGSATTFLNGGATPAFSTPDAQNIPVNSQSLQTFVLVVSNNAGTIQHAIRLMIGATTTALYATKISGASGTAQNTPTVGVGTGFTAGGGLTGNTFVFDTADQNTSNFFGSAHVEYYDGANTTCSVYPNFTSRNVNGTTRNRLEFYFTNISTGAAVNLTTTYLPSGKSVAVRFTGFLA